MSQKWINGILIGLLIVAIILGSVAIAKANKPPVIDPASPIPPAPSPGLGGAFGNILANIFSGDFWRNLFGKKDEYPVVDCDPNRPGYEKDGTANPNCGKSYTDCNYDLCDPNRPGWNQCGIPDNRCS